MKKLYQKIEDFIENPKTIYEWNVISGKLVFCANLFPKKMLDSTTIGGRIFVQYDKNKVYRLSFDYFQSLINCGCKIAAIKEYILGYAKLHLFGENDKKNSKGYTQQTVICKSTNQEDVEEFDKTCTELVKQGYETNDLYVVDGKLARVFYLPDRPQLPPPYVY